MLVAAAGAWAAAGVALASLLALLLQGRRLERLRLLGEQALSGQSRESETLRASLVATERALAAAVAAGSADAMGRALEGIDRSTRSVGVATERLRVEIEARLRELRVGNEASSPTSSAASTNSSMPRSSGR